MKPIRLMTQLAVWMVCLVGFNVAIQKAARSSIPRQLSRVIDTSPPVSDLFVGNSLVASGVDPQAFDLAHPGRHALNVGLGSSSPVEHLILVQRALSLKPRRVYYGFFDTQLISPAPGRWADLVGNRAMSYYLNLDLAIRFYAADDPLWAGTMRLIAHIPMLVERYAIWTRIEKLRRRFSEFGLPRQATNRFGRVDDFRLLESADSAEFLAYCQQAVDHRTEFTPPIRRMMQLLREHGISLIVVEMPMTLSHRSRFYDHPEWVRARRYFADEVRREGGTYVNASDWFPDDMFADHLHLNPAGAAAFSRKIAADR